MEALVPRDSVVLQIGDDAEIGLKINKLLNHPTRHVILDSRESEQSKKKTGASFKICDRSLSKVTLKDLESGYKLIFDFLILPAKSSSEELLKRFPTTTFKFFLGTSPPEGFYLIGESIYANMNLLPFKIRSHKLFYGNPGLFGMLGYMTNGVNQISIEKGAIPLSAHGPSKVVIRNDKRLYLRGYASTTASECPEITFYCDEDVVGIVSNPGKMTGSFKMEPGLHLLTVESDNRWCHSLWLFNELEVE